MKSKCHAKSSRFPLRTACILFSILVIALAANRANCESHSPGDSTFPMGPSSRNEINLKNIPFKIVYETYRETGGKENWELYMINADGSNPVNLTNTPDADEMYPHVSPDGAKICCVVDEIVGGEKVRNVYWMNIDGSGRVKVADNARQPCWGPDSKTIAYLPGEFKRYTIQDYATKGVFFYDTATRQHTEHPNKNLYHLYNICLSPDGQWFLATVHGGMGYSHAILAFKVDGMNVYDLTKFGVTGCRPDFSLDGKRLTWGKTDWDLFIADINFSSGEPRVTNVHQVVRCSADDEVYHTDFSPDGKYITFSSGPKATEMVGGMAPGWNICVSDLTGKWVVITADGNHDKEPDWVPIRAQGR